MQNLPNEHLSESYTQKRNGEKEGNAIFPAGGISAA
jgi:hypothetical protein